MKVAVIGVGHHGKLHARVYAGLPGVELAGVCDADFDRASQVASEHRTRPYGRIEDLPEGLDAVSVAVPTSHHFEVARFFLERGIAALVEKPMTRTSQEAKQLAEISRRTGAVLQPGYVERFNPVLEAVRAQVVRPRYLEAVRVSPFPFRSVDLGVVMDVMIHDLDLLLSFAKSEVVAVDAVGVRLLTAHEDMANARLRFADGCVASLTASRVATKTVREFRIFQDEAYFSLDYRNLKVKTCRKIKHPTPEDLTPEAAGPEGMARYVQVQEQSLAGEEPILAQLRAFTDLVSGRSRRVWVTKEEAVRALEVAEWVQREIQKNGQSSTVAIR